MCGIAGFISPDARLWSAPPASVLERMADVQRHRGPDDGGVWLDKSSGVGLAHRRLSIIDLSEAGHQPMISPCNRYVLSYNGEIYNFPQLRAELADHGHTFRGGSDTEVVLAAVGEWGIEGAVRRFVGMFAFALWDREASRLYLVRDRVGIKPLYFGLFDGNLLFASELKGIAAHPAFKPVVDRQALAQLLRYGYIPAPRSIYENVEKLRPGHIATFRAPGDLRAVQTPYWSLREVVERESARRLSDEAGVVQELTRLLRESIELRLVADVPVGCFLSGGIDSSTVVALAKEVSGTTVRTFTIGFSEEAENEAEDARRVAEYLSTDHTELIVSHEMAQAVIPELPVIYDEPFADSSAIPTYLVSRLAREHVTVALSGDGGDELFAGYNRHFWGRRLWRRLRHVPVSWRRLAAKTLLACPSAFWDSMFERSRWAIPRRYHLRSPGFKAHKLAGVVDAASPSDLYWRLATHWDGSADVVKGSVPANLSLAECSSERAPHDFTEGMLCLDQETYLPDDILTKVDRASMANSLEVRVPLLDHRVIEFSWRIPVALKLKGGTGKGILRQVLYERAPRCLFDRPKMGFGIPLATWLRGPLRNWADELLCESRLHADDYFHVSPILFQWHEFLSGRGSWEHHIWDILMFQAWLDARRQEGIAV